jgi:hypothetical protein
MTTMRPAATLAALLLATALPAQEPPQATLARDLALIAEAQAQVRAQPASDRPSLLLRLFTVEQQGTGYTTTHASWEQQNSRPLVTFLLDHSARPWGPDGGPGAADALPPPDLALYLQRYAGGGPVPSVGGVTGRGIGAWGEAIGLNVAALRRWWEQQSPEHRAAFDGVATVEEVYDAAFSQPRLGSFYRVDPPSVPTPAPTPAPTPVPTPAPAPAPRCAPIEPDVCPCELPTLRLRELLDRLIAWPRGEDGKLKPRAPAQWRLVADAEAERPALDGVPTCPCRRSVGHLSWWLCEPGAVPEQEE